VRENHCEVRTERAQPAGAGRGTMERRPKEGDTTSERIALTRALGAGGCAGAAFVVGSRVGAESRESQEAQQPICVKCEALLLPVSTCKITTKRASALRKKSRAAGVRFVAVCKRCGHGTTLGLGASRSEKRILVSETVPRKRLIKQDPPSKQRSQQHRKAAPKQKNIKRPAGSISVESARALGVLAASKATHHVQREENLSVLERLALGKSAPGAPPKQSAVAYSNKTSSTGGVKRKRETDDSAPGAAKKSTLANFLTSLRR
jgi:hypothetical protein